MSGADVRVDYDGVVDLARRIRVVVDRVDPKPLPVPNPGEVGHARLADALTHFASKWNPSVTHAHDAAEHLASNLVQAVSVYRTTDENVAGAASDGDGAAR